MRIVINEIGGQNRVWKYSPRTAMNEDQATQRAFERAFGRGWYFLRDNSLPSGYGTKAKNTDGGTHIGPMRLRVDIE